MTTNGRRRPAPGAEQTDAPSPASARGLRPRVVGHRGAALLEPENTLRSFRRALADGVDTLECDVHLTRDGHVAVMHDATIDRTADASSPRPTGALAELTQAELDEVRLPRGEVVPSLEELLALLDETGPQSPTEPAQSPTEPPQCAPRLLVEVKAPDAAAAVCRLVTEREDVAVISFHPEALATVRELAPGTPVVLVADHGDAAVALAHDLGAHGVALDVDHVSAADVARAHGLGLEVNVWTANTEDQLRRGLEAGADSISSDDPAWAIRQRERLASGNS